MKSAPASIAISDAARISASSFSSPVSMITFSSTFAAAQAFTGFYQRKANVTVTGNQRAVREHHVNFIRAIGDCRTGFRQRDVDVVVTVREVSDGRDADFRRARAASYVQSG